MVEPDLGRTPLTPNDLGRVYAFPRRTVHSVEKKRLESSSNLPSSAAGVLRIPMDVGNLRYLEPADQTTSG